MLTRESISQCGTGSGEGRGLEDQQGCIAGSLTRAQAAAPEGKGEVYVMTPMFPFWVTKTARGTDKEMRNIRQVAEK